jgi:hypothetical protein
MNTQAAIELVRAKIRLKHLAYSTEQAYCGWVARYCAFLKSVPAEWSSERKVEAFLIIEGAKVLGIDLGAEWGNEIDLRDKS